MWESIGNVADAIFGGDLPSGPLTLGQIAARSALVYMAGLAIVRMGKSRMISRFSPLDVLLALILGSILARAIVGATSLTGGAMSSVVLASIHWLLTWLTCRYHQFGNLIKGHTKLLVCDGQVLWDAMRTSHVSEHDLFEQIRLHANIEDLSLVKAAYKERNGEISVVKRRAAPQVMEIGVEQGVKTIRIELND
jgi:uncharacterized membrane protein YcaP (DUF421 family)